MRPLRLALCAIFIALLAVGALPAGLRQAAKAAPPMACCLKMAAGGTCSMMGPATFCPCGKSPQAATLASVPPAALPAAIRLPPVEPLGRLASPPSSSPLETAPALFDPPPRTA